MNVKWLIPEPVEETVLNMVVKKNKISPTIAEVLIRRGYTNNVEIHNFLHPTMGNLYDPFLMRDMDKTVERVIRAVKNKEKIMIYGDYDVDGVTGTALLMRILRYLDAETIYYIPHRRKEGYGLSLKGIEYAARHYVNLIITVDCGSGAVGAVNEALRNNIDVIVTDHHESRMDLPSGVPFLNPLFDDYPFKSLSGCGVAFKLCEALFKKLGLSQNEIYWQMDLVALASVCDVVPLVDENRVFVKHGLRCIKKTRNKGLEALLNVSGLSNADLDTYHLGYVIGPRVNARGRLEDANLAVQLFITEDKEEANTIAKRLSYENQKRMEIEERIVEEASILAEERREDYGLVLVGKSWHPGVIGIAASRITERFYKPTIIITLIDGVGKGSGRSIPEFNLFSALKECEEIFVTFGGHRLASGLTIDPGNIDKLKKKFNSIAQRELKDKELLPRLRVDAIVTLESITPELLGEIELLSPFGLGNPIPAFVSHNLQVVGYPNLIKNRHLKFNIRQQDKVLKAIAFDSINLVPSISTGTYIDAIYQVKENQYDNTCDLELNIKDIRLSSSKID